MTLPLKLAALAFLAIAWDPTAPFLLEHGYLTGGDYLLKPEAERHAYTEGVLDGVFSSTMLGGDLAVIEKIKSCLLPMKSNQVMAIFDKYLREHPEEWHLDADMLLLQAINIRACPGVIWPRTR
jgi:hypothetical protein